MGRQRWLPDRPPPAEGEPARGGRLRVRHLHLSGASRPVEPGSGGASPSRGLRRLRRAPAPAPSTAGSGPASGGPGRQDLSPLPKSPPPPAPSPLCTLRPAPRLGGRKRPRLRGVPRLAARPEGRALRCRPRASRRPPDPRTEVRWLAGARRTDGPPDCPSPASPRGQGHRRGGRARSHYASPAQKARVQSSGRPCGRGGGGPRSPPDSRAPSPVRRTDPGRLAARGA